MHVQVGRLASKSQHASLEATAALCSGRRPIRGVHTTPAQWPRSRRVLARLPLIVLLTFVAALGISGIQAALPADEQNWPQWRGPLQNGVAPQANPPTEWS